MEETNRDLYLDALRWQLSPLPQDEREDVVKEIESHILDSQEAGEPFAVVLAQLGEPQALAKAYLADYYLRTETNGSGLDFGQLFRAAGLVLGSGLLSILVVPTLAGIAFAFGITALLSPLLGVLRTFGADWIVIGGGSWQVPAEWSIPTTLVLSAIMGLIAWGAFVLLRHYMRWVLASYRKVASRIAPSGPITALL